MSLLECIQEISTAMHTSALEDEHRELFDAHGLNLYIFHKSYGKAYSIIKAQDKSAHIVIGTSNSTHELVMGDYRCTAVKDRNNCTCLISHKNDTVSLVDYVKLKNFTDDDIFQYCTMYPDFDTIHAVFLSAIQNEVHIHAEESELYEIRDLIRECLKGK